MSSSIEVNNLSRLPKEGCLIIPGRLDGTQAQQLQTSLGGRQVTWLAEESAQLPVDLSAYLEKSGCLGAAFDQKDPNPSALGETLKEQIKGGNVLIYVPEYTVARPATASQIPAETLRFLCALGLPITPLDISLPIETCLATENPNNLPATIFNFGEPIAAGKASVAAFRESILSASGETFSARDFLNGSLATALLNGLKKHSEKSTLFDGSDDSELSFQKLLGVVIAFSKEIKATTKKDRVGIILPPGKGGMIANLAVLFAGKVPVNLNFTASEQAARSSIRQADLDKFITADPFVRKLPSFPWPPNRDLIFVERIIPKLKKKIVKWVLISKFLPTSLLAKLLKLDARSGDDEAILLFTSGSSGEPKGVPLSHRNLLANICQFGRQICLPEGAKILGSLPLFHSLGCTVTLWYPIIEGIDVVTFPSPIETKRLAELIDQHSIYLLLATPTFLRGYMRHIKKEQLDSLKLVITGAEKLPSSLANAFEDKFNIVPMEGYGLTETSPATNVNLPLDDPQDGTPVIPANRFGSVGPPLPGLAVRITNPVNDEPLPLDQSGIIWFKGANIFNGYLNREETTKEVLVDEWFKTGDVGRMDDDGCLYIEGRISRFSKIAGEMVPHETVEEAITKVLELDQESERKIAIIGVPDEKKGEAIVLLSTVSGEALEQEQLNIRYKLLDQGIPALWCPKKIIPVEHIPILASGKLDIKGCDELVK